MTCSYPGCQEPGFYAEAGSDRRWCIKHRPKNPPAPCDFIVKSDPVERCGTMEDTIWFRTPGGVELIRCQEHRKAQALLEKPEYGY